MTENTTSGTLHFENIELLEKELNEILTKTVELNMLLKKLEKKHTGIYLEIESEGADK